MRETYVEVDSWRSNLCDVYALQFTCEERNHMSSFSLGDVPMRRRVKHDIRAVDVLQSRLLKSSCRCSASI